MIFADLVANLALLVACGSIYGLLAYRRNTSNTRTRIFAGILFGAVAVIGMMTPFVYAPGIIFDGRSVLLSIAGLFAGPITAGIAAAIAIAYRLWLGGGGALPGVAVIITSALFGVALYYKSKKQPHLVAAWQIYTLGIVVHVSMLLWMICLPGSAPAVLSTISLPIMVGFPLATLLLGSLLSNMERRFFAEAQLKASSDQYSDIIHAQTEMVDRWFPDGTLTFVNDAYCTFYGHTSEELLGRNWLGFVASEDREKLENYVQQLIPSLTPDQPVQTSEHREVDAGGEIRWTRWIDRGIFNDKDILEQIQSTGQDITERKQAQEQLRDREQRLSSIFKASPTGIGVVIDRVFVTVNDHFCHMTGYSEEELIGQSTRMVYPTDEDYAEVGRVKYEQIATHGVGTVETRFLCKDGRIINIILSSAPFDPEDLSSGVTFTALEVTERKQTEEALRLTQFSVDQSADAVYWMGPDAKLIYVNDAAVDALGYSKEELLTMTVHDIDPEFPRELWPTHWADLQEKRFFVIQTTHQRKDKSTFPVEIGVNLIQFGDREINCSIAKDITERKQAEEALSKSEEKLRQIIDNSTNLFYSHTPDHQITFLSPQTRQFFDCEPEEAMVIWTELASDNPINAKGFEITNEAIRTGKRQPSYEMELIATSRRKIWVEINETPVTVDGETVAVVGSLTDITERKRIEEEKTVMEAQLRQAQKLESLGTMAAGVAHEINNPLMGMINYADLIGMKIEDATLKEYSQAIMSEGDRIAKIVRNLLSFSRQDKETHSPAILPDIVDNTLSLVGTLIRKDQITVELDIPDALPQVKCRSQQIQQVLTNLLTNAHDALNKRYPTYDENKIIRISAKTFEKEGEQWIRTTVEDHGHGIPADLTDRIFDPFFSTKARHEGTGLGLSISFGIVREHHGELTVESAPGEITRFHMDLRVNNGWRHEVNVEGGV